MDDFSLLVAPQLRALTELAAHEGHMTQAAAALKIPQSTMSRRIHALETTLRTPLLVHDGRTVRLTPAAVALVQKARGPLRELDDALANTAGDSDEDTGTVRFGFPLTMGSGAVPDLLAAFRRKHPGIHLQLKQDHGSALIDDLRNGALDLAIMIPPPAELHHTVLATQKICLVAPQHHPLARASTVNLAELRSETFIANPLSYNLRQLTEEWCQKAKYTPNVAVEITEFATIRELIKRNLGVALLPRSERPLPGTIEIPLRGDQYRREISLAWVTTNQTAVTKRFAEFVLSRGIAPSRGSTERS